MLKLSEAKLKARKDGHSIGGELLKRDNMDN